MSGFGSNSVLGKEIGPVTVGQIIAMIIALVIGILLYTYGGANSIFVILIVAIVAYMIPHLFGADPKTKAVFGVIFAVIALVVGAFAVGPACIDTNSSHGAPERNGIIFEMDDAFNVTATYSGTEDLTVVITEVNGVVYNSIILANLSYHTMTKSGSTYTVALGLDSSKLYSVSVAPLDAEGKAVLESSSYSVLTGFNFTGSKTDCTLIPTAYIIAYTMILFFLILGLTTLLRNRAYAAREKMETQGRLYPQGYGRCNFCGAVVLPGEVNCRKCGAYIDRPDYMKPHKKDYFACSVCGAEVSSDMTECPKCGAKFDGVESTVIHTDGSEETSSETKPCPECSKDIPSVAERCPYCGKKFQE